MTSPLRHSRTAPHSEEPHCPQERQRQRQPFCMQTSIHSTVFIEHPLCAGAQPGTARGRRLEPRRLIASTLPSLPLAPGPAAILPAYCSTWEAEMVSIWPDVPLWSLDADVTPTHSGSVVKTGSPSPTHRQGGAPSLGSHASCWSAPGVRPWSFLGI